MVHGEILALEIYFLLILLIQYNIILIMINFRYIILLFANKQWGLLILKKDHAQEPDSNFVQESLSLPLSLKIVVCGISTCNVLINTYCYIHATLPTLTIGRNPYNADTKHYYLIVGK